MVAGVGGLAVPGGGARALQCALILEDNPVGEDSKLVFESFPIDEGVEESYALQPYHEIANGRVAQPGQIDYQGGNWNPFQLKLTFRAGLDTPTAFAPTSFGANALNVTDIDRALIEMERKVRWCEALAFPLERSARGGIQQALSAAGFSESDTAQVTKSADGLKRVDPPIVLVQFGGWHTIRGYVMNVSLLWTAPFHPVTARPYGCDVSLSFQPQMSGASPTWQQIRNLAGGSGFTTFTIAELKALVAFSTEVTAATVDRARDARRSVDNAGRRIGGV